MRAFLPRNKKLFFDISQKIIDKKLSLENLMEISIKLEILNNFILNEEERIKIKNNILFKLEDHLKENYLI